MKLPRTEAELIAIANALAGPAAEYSPAERKLLRQAGKAPNQSKIDWIRDAILAGMDPLGDAFCGIVPPRQRRGKGAVYTPKVIVTAMVRWAASQGQPARIVDPGAGSGRFMLMSAALFPGAALHAVEADPFAALLLRANITVRGIADRTRIYVDDYRRFELPATSGATLFIGNPPYVRHHDINERWKNWFADAAAEYGVKASKLAGLHLHFFVKTLQLARKGDYGAYITSAEWLDVNYGAALRKLLADGLGGYAIHVFDPTAMPFADATTTGVITCFRVGHKASAFRVHDVKSAEQFDEPGAGRAVSWSEVKRTDRWSTFIRRTPKPPPGFIELGEICRIHRGQVTGSNKIWIAGDHANCLPSKFLIPTVTHARELLEAPGVLLDAARLRKVIDLPVDLDDIEVQDRKEIDRFLDWAKQQGAQRSYIARNRKAWWAVGLRVAAPIICTYMARRPPAFVRNLCAARHINIAHGLYPREPLSDSLLRKLVRFLADHVGVESGRTYAGGLTKFEPKELERVPIPSLENLAAP